MVAMDKQAHIGPHQLLAESYSKEKSGKTRTHT